jgi:hypothetical protein
MQRGYGIRATEQVRAGLWWDTRGRPHPVTPPRPSIVPTPSEVIECDGHNGSRHRWMTGSCRSAGCEQANRLYEAAYYVRRRALRRSTKAA